MSERALVAVVMGSESDLPVMQSAVEVLEEFGVPFQVRVLSAHRSPEAVREFACAAAGRGLKLVVAAAGGAAHLAGVIASLTALPVIGVPMPTDRAGGLDSLLSMVQMPGGVPVATMGMGSSGARNAALLAVRVLALQDAALAAAYAAYQARQAERVAEADARVQEQLRKPPDTGG